MSYKSDPQIFTDAYKLYLAGEYQKAYDLLTEAAPRYPDEGSRISEWRMDMAARLGKLELTEAILSEALNAGYFYGEYVLRKDEDMKAMQGRPVFEELVKRNFEMLIDAQKKAHPKLKVINSGEAKNGLKPLFMAMHGNSSNADRFKEYWHVLLKTQWLVALPQSSQVNGKDVYVWNDMEIVEWELKSHYAALARKYPIDPKRTIISGFSKGGYVAIEAALKGYFPIAGFIAIAPYISDREAMVPLLDSIKNRKLRGYILAGEKDTDCIAGATWLHDELVKRGIACEMKVYPDLAHEFPDDFDTVLPEIIRFILPE